MSRNPTSLVIMGYRRERNSWVARVKLPVGVGDEFSLSATDLKRRIDFMADSGVDTTVEHEALTTLRAHEMQDQPFTTMPRAAQ